MTEPMRVEEAPEIGRGQAEMFPVDNPEVTDGPGGIPRRADALLRMLLDEFQQLFDVTMAFPKQVEGDERRHMLTRQVDTFGQAFLLAALREFAPANADKVAAALADQWDGGDGLGEWVYQWRQELDAGQPLTLPIEEWSS